MGSALSELRADVARHERQFEEYRRRLAEEKRARELAEFEARVRGVCSENLLAELEAEVVGGDGYCSLPGLRITYRGVTKVFRSGKVIYDLPTSLAEVCDGIDKELECVARDREGFRVRAIEMFNEVKQRNGRLGLTFAEDLVEKWDKRYGIVGMEGVQAAWTCARARVARVEARERAEAVEKAEALLAEVEAVEFEEGWQDRLGLLAEYFLDDCVCLEGALSPDEFDAKLDARRRVLQAQEDERERRRVELERERFVPWRFYRVWFSVMAQEDGREPVLGREWLLTFNPDRRPDGWYGTVHGQCARPENVFLVEAMDVRSPADLPAWCPKEQTEFGLIRVKPPRAVLLDPEEVGCD